MCFAARHVDISAQRDYRRDRKVGTDRLQKMPGLFDDDGFFGEYQIDSTRQGNYRQRLPTTAIEEKNTPFQTGLPSPIIRSAMCALYVQSLVARQGSATELDLIQHYLTVGHR